MPRPQTEERFLTVELTPEERRQKGDELAGAVLVCEDGRKDLERKKAAWSATQKALKQALMEDEAECERLARIVESGEEERRVPCSWLYSLKHGLAFLVRDDTGALVAHRDLVEDERQTDLLDSHREPTPEQLAEWLPEVDAAESEGAAGEPFGDSNLGNDLLAAMAGEHDEAQADQEAEQLAAMAEAPPTAEAIDLMEALRASLAATPPAPETEAGEGA